MSEFESRPTLSMASRIVAWSRRGGNLRRRLAQGLLVLLFGLDIPASVKVGKDVEFLHNGLGTVIHPNVVIGAGALICQNVTIGDGTMWRGYDGPGRFDGVIIGEGATISTGAKILGSRGQLVVGRGSVIGANAVLLTSTGEYEIWAGIPARFIRRVNF